jgi:NAD(P)-dependent dehydrogenase (short-subunit alcohol dehydrogenase family)
MSGFADDVTLARLSSLAAIVGFLGTPVDPMERALIVFEDTYIKGSRILSYSVRGTQPDSNRLRRISKSMIGQGSRTMRCPQEPPLVGKKILITGGASGVGEFVSRGLIARGASVTSLARGVSKSKTDLAGLTSRAADLSDPQSILSCVAQLDQTPFDIIIFNAGINSSKYEETPMGLEKTYAVNVFGHHLLFKALEKRGLLKPGARVVFTTGDIYVLANDCTPEFKFSRGQMAYARSKLGNLWQVAEMTRRYPDLHPIAVHPGVVASGFVGAKTGPVGWIKERIFISEEAGAQSALIGATQSLVRGAYWHNVFGLVDLSPADIAMDAEKSGLFWERLQALVEDVMGS